MTKKNELILASSFTTFIDKSIVNGWTKQYKELEFWIFRMKINKIEQYQQK